jgi:TetR/AcrR family transcriptional regulator, fatty acid metabolism regulator protein
MRPINSPDVQESHSFIGTARRAQIIESAIETIATLGYAKASLAQIAKRAKISKGVISYYFGSKDELIQQIVIQVYTAAAYFMMPYIEAEATARGMLRAFIESNLAFMRAHPQQLLALVEIFTNFRTQEGRPFYGAAENEPNVESLEAVLRMGQESGEFRAFSTRVMALTIRSAIDMVPGQMVLHPDLDLASYGRELATLFDQATRNPS